jgi:hypothetical protein
MILITVTEHSDSAELETCHALKWTAGEAEGISFVDVI